MSLAPDGFTIADVLAGVQARGYSSDTAAAQMSLVQSALRRLSTQRRWPWLETTVQGDINAGELSMVLPLDVDTVTGVRVLDGATFADLEHVKPAVLRSKWYSDPAPGTPTHWTFNDGRQPAIAVWPIPARVYTLDVDAIAAPAVPTDTTDRIPYVPDEFVDVLVLGACAEMASRQRDWNAVQAWTMQYDARLAELWRARGQRDMPGEMDRWDGWDNLGSPDNIIYP